MTGASAPVWSFEQGSLLTGVLGPVFIFLPDSDSPCWQLHVHVSSSTHTMTRIGSAGLFIAQVLFFCLPQRLQAQSAGDYGSWSSGNWNTASIWRVYDGSSWATSPTAVAAPGANDNVFVRTNVIAVYGGTYYCNNLTVEAGGKLYNNNTGATNLSYVHVFGASVICDGQIGNGATLDGISFAIDGANVTLTGSGTFSTARLVKQLVAHPITLSALTTTNFTIGMNVNLRFITGSTTMLFNYCTSASVFNVTINSGATVTLLGASGQGNVAIDGLDGAGTYNTGGTLTVNGSLIIPGTLYMKTNNGTGGNACRIVVGTGGYIRATTLDAGLSGAATHRIDLLPGSTMEVTGTPSAWANYSIAGNTYVFNANSQFIYSGIGSQDVRGIPGGYGHLRITGFGTKTLFGSTAVKGNLLIDNVNGAAELDVSTSNFQLNVAGNWNNYHEAGFNERTGMVMFNGTAGSQTLTTPGGENFQNWTLAKSTVQPLVTLNSPVQVAGYISINTGILDLNGNQLTILSPFPTAITTNSTFGTYRQIRSEWTDNSAAVRWDIGTNTGVHVVPFGMPTAYIPFTFTVLSGDAGSVTMATYGTPPDNLPWPTTPIAVTNLGSYLGLLFPDNRDATVDRFWEVDVTGTPSAELSFTYAPTELPVAPYNDPNTLRAQRWNSSSVLWEPQITGSSVAYSAVADVVSDFGPFTLSNMTSPLPIELLSFDAVPEADKVFLSWVTASERDNAFFTILRSDDGIGFEAIERLDGAGQSATALNYSTIDASPLDGVSYYKLRQTDVNGDETESATVTVHRFSAGSAPMLYPNPVEGQLFVSGLPDGPAELLVLDATGRVVLRKRKESDGPRIDLDVAGLPIGMYTLRLINGGNQRTLPFVRQ